MSDQRLARCKEYLTTGKTLAELKKWEPVLRKAGFRKRRNCHGQSPNTKEFYQWWDRKKTDTLVGRVQRRRLALRAEHRCIICGNPAVASVYKTKDGYGQYCEHHQTAQREYQRRYRENQVKQEKESK